MAYGVALVVSAPAAWAFSVRGVICSRLRVEQTLRSSGYLRVHVLRLTASHHQNLDVVVRDGNSLVPYNGRLRN